MANIATTTRGLRAAIERSGYYPALVAEGVEFAVGSESISSYLVHQDTTFDHDEVFRHITVMVLTPSRLVVGHTDEHSPDESSATPHATTTTQSIPLNRITSVAVTRVVANPAGHTRGDTPREVVLTIGWDTLKRVDVEPAACGDPNCEADHGYTGTITAGDPLLRVSEAVHGAEVVAQTLAFAAALSEATARK